MGKAVLLLQGQGVHVGAQADGAQAGARAQHAHHAGAGQPAMDLDAQGLQGLRHQGGGAHLLESGFRVGVDVAPQGGKMGGLLLDAGRDVHGAVP
jgi:hypothetical protein